MPCAGARVIVNVPVSLVHPDICGTIVNVPAPEVISAAMLPCIVKALGVVPPGGVHDILNVMGPPLVELRLPLMAVPGPKHCETLSLPLKFRLLATSVTLF